MKPLPRLILVPFSFVATAAVGYILVLACQWLLNHTLDPALAPPEFDSHTFLTLILNAFALFAGGIRAIRFQPAFNKNYTRWLAATPWRSAQPLPLGPLHLVWQDFLLLALLYALDHFHLHNDGSLPLLLFLLAYLLISFVALIRMQLRFIPRLFIAVLPAALLFTNHHAFLLALFAIEYIIVIVGFHSALPHFPWKLLDAPKPSPAGWPFDSLGPVDPKPLVPFPSALYYSALLAWWMFCICAPLTPSLSTNPPPHAYDPNINFFMVLGFIVAFGRTVAYARVLVGSSSLFGRIAARRLIIPAYDRIFLGPLAIVAASALSATLLYFLSITPLTAAASTFLITAPAFFVGPTLNIQKLTGAHRCPKPPKAQSPRASANTQIKIQIHLDQFKAF